MRMYCIEFTDVGHWSHERYYVSAKNKKEALKLVEEKTNIKRPHIVTRYNQGDMAIEIY